MDTWSSQSLVSADLTSKMSCVLSPTSISITGIASSPLNVQGSVRLYVSRMDESVRLPQYDAICIVV